MASPSAASSASTGIGSPGGSVNKNSPGIVAIGIGAVVLIAVVMIWKKKGGK